MDTWIKICGVTRVDDARLVAELGADAIGLNFVASSKRLIGLERAAELARVVREVRGRTVEIVGVFADRDRAEVARIRAELDLDAIQLHGGESPEELSWFLEQGFEAYKAVRIGSRADVALAERFPGQRLLVDAKVGGELGGTGHTFDWSLISGLNKARRLILAGGITPFNVEDAIGQLEPYGVDTASGVEFAPGLKDASLVAEFIERCRRSSGAS